MEGTVESTFKLLSGHTKAMLPYTGRQEVRVMTDQEFQNSMLEFQKEMRQRFEKMDQRFDGLDNKIDGLRDEMNGKFAALTLNLIRSGSLKPEDVAT